MKLFRTFIAAFALLTLGQTAFAGSGELLLFYQNGDDAVTEDFRNNFVPKIREMAESQDISVKEVSVTDVAPELIHATPAVVFQNHLGRSLYIGRYHYVDKIKTFIRTVKRMPQQDVVNEKHDVLVWNEGRATVLTPVKVTELGGTLPAGFDQAKFKKAALKAIDKGMARYKLSKHYEARRTDRLMYSAFYPFRSEDGKLFISMEAYSQFNCVIPVYKEFEAPVSGSWKEWEKVFEEAGKIVEGKIVEALNSVELGDGLLPLSSSVAAKDFEAMGFPLPEKPEGSEADFSAVDVKLSQNWVMDGPIAEDVPVVNFAFGAPVDYYSGEISKLQGYLKLDKALAIGQAVAKFSTDMHDLTMGDESLDHSVHDMISVVDHPEASFTFDKIEVLDQPNITFGAVTQVLVDGVMDFKGIKAPLRVASQIEPVLTESGEPRLQVYASFKLANKDNYGVEGPDGPDEAVNFMDFNLNFLLKPAE